MADLAGPAVSRPGAHGDADSPHHYSFSTMLPLPFGALFQRLSSLQRQVSSPSTSGRGERLGRGGDSGGLFSVQISGRGAGEGLERSDSTGQPQPRLPDDALSRSALPSVRFASRHDGSASPAADSDTSPGRRSTVETPAAAAERLRISNEQGIRIDLQVISVGG